MDELLVIHIDESEAQETSIKSSKYSMMSVTVLLSAFVTNCSIFFQTLEHYKFKFVCSDDSCTFVWNI